MAYLFGDLGMAKNVAVFGISVQVLLVMRTSGKIFFLVSRYYPDKIDPKSIGFWAEMNPILVKIGEFRSRLNPCR